jgi:chemotaxis protein CheD
MVMTTLLGSCVAVCLYDPLTGIAGMNHFLLGNKRYAKNMPMCITEAGRYGIHAMELIINEMLKMGARRVNLHAKAFGGGSLLYRQGGQDNFFCVGKVNERFILEFLRNEGIPLVRADLGGDSGRVIHFVSDHTYAVYVRKIRKTLNPRLVQKEKQFWQKSIETQEHDTAEPDIWL